MSVITRDNKIEYFLRRREEEYSLNAVSATPPVSEGSAVVCPHPPRVRPHYRSGITRG